LDDVTVKGKQEPRRIYELITSDVSDSLKKTLEAFAKGRASYIAGDWKTAISHFEEALLYTPEDGPSTVFIERCQQLQKNPPSNWNGVFAFETK
jgi:adenylate cyclase